MQPYTSANIVVEKAFGRLKNCFSLPLHFQNASLGLASNNEFDCMILDNLLNQNGSLLLQCLDASDRSSQLVRNGTDVVISMINKSKIICDIRHYLRAKWKS
ncbi:hypothetical protein VP01_1307g3, partial [Puccinia sorghi]